MDCSPKEILILLINEYCNKYCDMNLWTLERIHNYAVAIESNSKDEKRVKRDLKNMVSLLEVLQEKQYNIVPTIDSTSINDLKHVILMDNIIINYSTKESLTDVGIELFSLLEATITRLQIANSILILKHILGQPANKVITKGSYIIDVIFDFLFHLSKGQKADKVRDYIGYSKDIFTYQLKRTDKETRNYRLPLLFNSLLICIQQRTSYQVIDYACKEETIKLDKYNYMYLLPIVDNDIVEEVKQLKLTKRNECKDAIKVDMSRCKDFDKFDSIKNKINIIRIKNVYL